MDITPAKLPLANDIAKLRDKTEDFVGDTAERRGAKGLAVLEDVNFIAIPDLMAGVFQRENIAGELGPEVCVMDDRKRANILAVQKELVDYCELLNDRMAILDPIPDLNPQEVAQSIEGNFSCDHGQAALYYPWIKVPDMLNRRAKATIMVPPCGHVAGVWARTAIERGVHKAPANESVKGAVGLAYDVTKGEQEILNPIGVNCIRTFSASGIRIWGARTLATAEQPLLELRQCPQPLQLPGELHRARHAVGGVRAERPRPLGPRPPQRLRVPLDRLEGRHALRPDAGRGLLRQVRRGD